MPRKEKRNKLEIYNDILSAILQVSSEGEPKPTRVQQKCNMSYDKFSKYIEELGNRKLITHDSPLCITDKGKRFLQDYGKIKSFIQKMKIKYVIEKEIEYDT